MKLVLSILNQVQTSSLDWNKICDDIGVDKVGTAKMRFMRLKAKHSGEDGGDENAGSTPASPVKKSAPKKTATATPKKNGGGKRKANGKAGGESPTKMAKAGDESDEEDVKLAEDDDVEIESKSGHNHNGT